MTINPEEVRTKLEAGRTAVAGRLRGLANQIEALPLEDAAEVITWIGDHIEGLLRSVVARRPQDFTLVNG